MVGWGMVAIVGKGQEEGQDITEEEGGARKEVVVGQVTWAQVEVIQSIHKDTTQEMAMPK